MGPKDLLEGLNEPQREAVLHGSGPLLILAGAGSGKTAVLTRRMAHLVHSGRARPSEILAITFTNKAAAEMRDRVEMLVGRQARLMWVMTFHSACARMLRSDGDKLGYTRGFTIYDQADSLRLVKQCVDQLDIDPKRFSPRGIQRQISDAKNVLKDAGAYREQISSFFEQSVADVYELYEQRIHRMNAMDFDDLLMRSVNLLELFPSVRERYQHSFQHVLVDEYQDTNRAQYRWLQILAEEHRNLSVVGDDDQCLLEGTTITMADGSKRPIEQIAPGEHVLASYGSGDFRPATVTDVFSSTPRSGVAITLRSGRRLVSTPDHVHFAGYHPEGPHHMPSRREGRRGNVPVTVTLCGDWRRRSAMHNVAVGRSQSSFSSYGDAMAYVDRIQRVTPVRVRQMARFGSRSEAAGKNSLPFLPASSVREGMVMFDEKGGYDVVETVEAVALDRPVYDLNVAEVHNFIANGIVTHNSIYRFRGADIRNILDFEDDYQDAHVIKLEQNYRSTQTILSAANAVVSNNRSRKSKALWTAAGAGDPVHVREAEDEHAEARFVAGEIERMVDQGRSRDEVAVFYRTNAQSRVLEDTLVRYGVGYQVIGGTKFYERAEIKDALSYLTWIINPSDAVSFQRVVNSPRRGIGNTTQARIISYANTMGEDVWDIAANARAIPGLGAAAIKSVGRFMSVMERLRERVSSGSVGDLLQEALEESGYLGALEAERTIEAEGRLENLQELVGVAREYDQSGATEGEEPTVEEFLQQISLFSDQDGIQDDEGIVTLMTLHNAKGLEYPVVFILGCEDGVFPHQRAVEEGDIEEERRLCYVGITRARERLYMTFARTRSLHGGRDWNLPSRFLGEIPIELTDREHAGPPAAQSTTWGDGQSAEPAGRGASFHLGDDVVHAMHGEGVVTGLDLGSGVVMVRFASDGSERKLMVDYAPLKKR